MKPGDPLTGGWCHPLGCQQLCRRHEQEQLLPLTNILQDADSRALQVQGVHMHARYTPSQEPLAHQGAQGNAIGLQAHTHTPKQSGLRLDVGARETDSSLADKNALLAKAMSCRYMHIACQTRL